MEHAESLAAASWWTDRLMSPPDHHSGSGLHSSALNQLAESQEPLKDGDFAFFSAILRSVVNSEIDYLDGKGTWTDGGVVILSTDYGPTGLLRQAADQAHIKGLRFPVKTAMCVRPGMVEASLGYGAEMETVWRAS